MTAVLGTRPSGPGSVSRAHERRSRARRAAPVVSALAHAVVLWLLATPQAEEFYGVVGQDFGAGMTVSLVDGRALRESEQLSEMQSPAPTIASAPSGSTPGPDVLAVQTSDGVPIPLPDGAEPSQGAQAEAPSLTEAVLAAAAPKNDVEGASTHAAGGDPAATGSILNQIARCLPADMRPNLGLARLVVKVGEGGVLAAAPSVELPLGVATSADRASADRIVQATLQCGPYVHPAWRNTEFALTPDFSKLQPQ